MIQIVVRTQKFIESQRFIVAYKEVYIRVNKDQAYRMSIYVFMCHALQ